MPSQGSRTDKDTRITVVTVFAWPQSTHKYVCYAQHTADLISYAALIRVGYLERREGRDRELLPVDSLCVKEPLGLLFQPTC